MTGKDDEDGFGLKETADNARRAIGKASRSKRWRFVVSFLSSFLLLVLVVLMITTGFAQVIASISTIGGIQAEIGELRGNDVNIYPAVGESSNCPWQTPGTFSGPQEDPPGSGTPRFQNPVSAGDQALPQLRADITQARIPAGYGLSFTKDVRLPGPFGADAFRVEITRNETLVAGTAALFEAPVNQDFESGGSTPAGWITPGSASVTTNTQNSGRYSAQVSMGSTTNEVISPTVDTSLSSGNVRVEFWVQRGSDDISNLPEDGENLIVEYLDPNGNWNEIPSSPIRASDFRPEQERVIRDGLFGSDALHGNFQLRFRGNGAGSTGGFDYWHVDDVKVERSRYTIPRATSNTDQFLTSVSLTSNNAAVSSKVSPIQESTALDRDTGRRDLTKVRMYLVKGTEYELSALMDTVETTTGAGLGKDYNQETSAARAWIDWDNDTTLGDGSPSGAYSLGSGDGGANGVEDVSSTFTVPTNADTGPTLLRVMMEAGEANPGSLDPNTDVNKGSVEDYTVVVVDSLSDVPEPVSIGDASLKTSGLEADYVDLRGGAAGSQFVLEDK